ncbi:MAG: hypothetical protein ACK550_08380 [Synechococcaceae cyanobacterium]
MDGEEEEHHPDACRHCDTLLDGQDSAPLRHQLIEIPRSAAAPWRGSGGGGIGLPHHLPMASSALYCPLLPGPPGARAHLLSRPEQALRLFRRLQDSPQAFYLPLGPQRDRGGDSASR